MAKIFLGCDPGYGGLKLYGEGGGRLTLAHVVEARETTYDFGAIGMSDTFGKSAARKIGNGIGSYWVGAGATQYGRSPTRLDFDRLSGSTEIKALLYAGLSGCKLKWNDQIHLCVGVPLGFVAGDQAKTRVAELRGWLTRSGETDPVHRWTDNDEIKSARITHVSILAQAHAAYLDYTLNMDGEENENALSETVGVISLGSNTVEMIALDSGELMPKYFHSESKGVVRMLEAINREQRTKRELAEIDLDLRSGKIERDIVARAGASWSNEISGVVASAWGNAQFAKVLVVGGGVRFAIPKLKQIFGTRLVLSAEPILSISRGLYKFGQTQHG